MHDFCLVTFLKAQRYLSKPVENKLQEPTQQQRNMRGENGKEIAYEGQHEDFLQLQDTKLQL